MVPSTEGVEYLVGDKAVEAGTYPGTGKVTVKARAKTDYVLAGGAAAEWSTTFKTTPYAVTPAAVVFVDKDSTAEDAYTVPSTDGVEYLVGDHVVEAGSHAGSGTVTVKARAKSDYVLAEGAAVEWSATFKATPYAVTPAAVVFTDKDGTAEDTYTIPAIDGVDYLTGDTVVEAGTHPGSGTVTVKARATTDYVLTEGATAEWSSTFKATPYKVTPAAVVFTDKDGTAEDSYAVPSTGGVEYLLGDKVVEAGTYPGAGTVTVKARATAYYVLAEGAAAEWSSTFKATPYEVTPAAVVFTDKEGTAEDTYTIPAIDGVDYLTGDTVVEAGTHPGSGTVTLKARATTDYVLAEGAAAEWSATFKATPYAVTPAAVVFTDKDGNAEDTYTVPSTEGVEYLVGEQVVEAGTHPGTATITITARAKTDYVLADDAVFEWSATFKATPYTVTPAAVVFTDKDGTTEDTYTLPMMEGVEYVVGDQVVAGGPYPGTGTVTVRARAKGDYVLAEGAAAEWSATFKATPYAVTPAAVVFMDRDGTAEDTYTVPTMEGVEYVVGDEVVAGGPYPGTGTVTVKARAKTDYVLAEGVTAEWTSTFKASPYMVTPAAVVFTDKDGTADDTYTVPSTEGVEYLVEGILTGAGNYPGTGTITVTARAKTDYVLAEGATAEWSSTFKVTPYTVTAAAVVFSDKDGTAGDTFTVPATDGVEYLIDGSVVEAGNYPGSGTVTVKARAKADYILAAGAAAEWTNTFRGSLSAPVPTITGTLTVGSTLTSVPGIWTPEPDSLGYQWYRSGLAIADATGASYNLAIADVGTTITVRVTGAKAGYGTATAESAPVSVAAPPSFNDIHEGSAFASEISWLASAGVTQGWTEADGTRTFRSAQPVNRDQMAAFLYRLKGSPDFVPPAQSPFSDVPTTHNFFKEISWLWSAKISEGWKEADGTWTFRPAATVNRDQMAAFIYRHAGSPDYLPEAQSPFVDIPTNHNFYKEISWLAKNGISNGWTESVGSKTFRPASSILRDQMAAFMYRYATRAISS
ncbi:S-layer homology domain-containing protein [Arthrobacter sp. ISL-72]|nr:S-layer homology domain-containing protein [Arthrobacter sp. ISL-72]